MTFDDASIRKDLCDILETRGEDRLTTFEFEFINNILEEWEGCLTAKQTSVAADIIERYPMN